MAGHFSQLGKRRAPAKAALRYLGECSCGIAGFSGRTRQETIGRNFAHLADNSVEQKNILEYDAATKRKILVIHIPVFVSFTAGPTKGCSKSADDAVTVICVNVVVVLENVHHGELGG
jgi:hypothetical protein